MVTIDSAHNAWPGSTEHQVSLALTLHLMTFLVQQGNINTKEREALKTHKLLMNNYIYTARKKFMFMY